MKQTRLLSKTIAALFIALIPILTAAFLLAGIYYRSNQADMTILGFDMVSLMYTLLGMATLAIVALPILLWEYTKRTTPVVTEQPFN